MWEKSFRQNPMGLMENQNRVTETILTLSQLPTKEDNLLVKWFIRYLNVLISFAHSEGIISRLTSFKKIWQ
jgi:hypothetical protein